MSRGYIYIKKRGKGVKPQQQEMIKCLLILLNLFYIAESLVHPAFKLAPFNHWHCIDLVKNIDKKKPNAYKVGNLTLVTWYNKNNPITTINICPHMGSTMNQGTVNNGCLVCPYHGFKHDRSSAFGSTVEHQGRLFWSYNPIDKKPPSIPFYDDPDYETSHFTMDVSASVPDLVMNFFDLNHPEFVHPGLLGFGSNVPPKNIKVYSYPSQKDVLGLSFEYRAKTLFSKIMPELHCSQNFHLWKYPNSFWSRVSTPNNQHLYVCLDLLPLEQDRTRLFATIRHNFFHGPLSRFFMSGVARTILEQDERQFKRLSKSSLAKAMMIFNVELNHEDHFSNLKRILKNYRYPDDNHVAVLVSQHLKKP